MLGDIMVENNEQNPEVKRGAKTLFERYLGKNPELKKMYEEVREKQGKSTDDYQEADIATVDDLIEYMLFELTRTKDENALRGKTFVDYTKNFIELYNFKLQIEQRVAETDAKCKRILEDRHEAEVFMKIIYEAISTIITDTEIRKKLSDEIDKLYDKYYPTDTDKKTDADSHIQPSGESER